MITWEAVYEVVAAMTPLYFALLLGYASVRWWRIFTREECEPINKLVYNFTLPLLTLDFTSQVDPYHLNFAFLAADAISKLLVVLVLALWAKCTTQADTYSWSITTFSLCTLANTLVIGMPLMRVMYPQLGVDLIVQSSAVQSIIWLPLLILVLELRRTGSEDLVVVEAVHDEEFAQGGGGNDVDGALTEDGRRRSHLQLHLLKKILLKLAANPNSYACIFGLAWALLAKRWNIQMPTIVEGSIEIMSRAGTGTAMFNMGIFMAMQENFIACGFRLTLMGMMMRFIAGPAAMAIASIAMRLHGDVLRVVIIQAALPQSIATFIFAKEYGLHAKVLSTAVIFGTIASLPVLVAYYAVLEFLKG